MAQLEPYIGDYYLWHYLPSRAASAICALVFAITTAVVAWRMWKTKTWYCSVFAIGGLFEVIGFAARISAYNQTGKMMPFVIQNTFILLAPALFAASVYMVLGRIIQQVHGEALSIVPVRWLTKLFVFGDVMSFMVQGGAAGLMATGGHAQMGENMVVGGLLVQVTVFGLFVVTTVIFQMRIRKNPTSESLDPTVSWKKYLYMLYAISLLIITRSVFRVVEYAMGSDGYPLRHEWTLYVFDALLMAFVMVIFIVQYPSGLGNKLYRQSLIPLQDRQYK
ncbi:hypothetical protein G7046_g3802 [Stylonectria norvegica]|nr:hypothetical protein G7046_g3802 [Stylonectria norvegica]